MIITLEERAGSPGLRLGRNGVLLEVRRERLLDGDTERVLGITFTLNQVVEDPLATRLAEVIDRDPRPRELGAVLQPPQARFLVSLGLSVPPELAESVRTLLIESRPPALREPHLSDGPRTLRSDLTS